MSTQSRWATWLWRLSVVQAPLGLVALVAACVPAAHVSGAGAWVVLGVVLAIVVAGFVLAGGAFLGGLTSMPVSRVSETEWNRLPAAQRRELSRALRRGEAIDPQRRELARWYAEHTVRAALPQAALQGSLAVMWLGGSLAEPIQDSGWWWFHVGLGTLQLAFALAATWVVGRMRARVARLAGELAASQ